MSISKNSGRQEVVSARVDFAFGDFDDTNAHEAFDMPNGAVVVGGFVAVEEAFDTGVTLNVGVDGAASGYASTVALDAAGVTELTVTSTGHGGDDPVLVTPSAAVTKGSGYAVVNYVVKTRAAFSQG